MKALSRRQCAQAEVTIGKRIRASVSLDLTPVGIMAVTALVGGILMATKELVAAAIRESR